ncbi:hypothetical protein EYZ11_012464 [Aspergillus tanneri]|uniref:Uncharacterized protein n=1 Tax=Aspergillus tanneri TaxID=1220188 RepID=A0A4S3J069_9EURO|nr:uncharacterized protein ATNIH1004_010978 [Aspergillus tanneri]KAA8642038.1 hypothetical protein ATNIH1004_010978 [Aspergillus tanneri]THC88090.1 hypothetical protein EYZ11_012464 [Aspergillus tanneri]
MEVNMDTHCYICGLSKAPTIDSLPVPLSDEPLPSSHWSNWDPAKQRIHDPKIGSTVAADPFYRTIIKDFTKQPSFYVAGAFQDTIKWMTESTVPIDKHTTRKRNSTDPKTPTVAFTVADPRQRDNWVYHDRLGFTIHEQCWRLVGIVLGHASVERNLEIFIEGLQTVWNIALSCQVHRRQALDPNPTSSSSNHGSGHLVDPVHIPELRGAISIAMERASGSASAPTTKTEIPCAMSLRLGNIPFDIQYLILETLEDPRDKINMMDTFQWRFADGFWHRRFPRFLVFEYYDLRSKNVDWMFLTLIMGIVWTQSPGLQHRAQIMKLLLSCKNAFDQLVQERDETNVVLTRAGLCMQNTF